MSTLIHPTSLVDPGARLGENVQIGPFCIVGAGAEIGDNTRLISHIVVDGTVQIGRDNLFYSFCGIGAPPQDLTYKGEPTKVVIGDRNIFRESCTVHRGTAKDKGVTTVGDDNYVMAYCHIAHDCRIGKKLVMANSVALAGHVEIGDHVNIGGLTGITQWCRIGDYAFIGAGSVLRRDLPPYMCAKEFSDVSGPNLVGLRRSGMSDDEIRLARELYKTLYLGNQTTEKSIEEMEGRFGADPFARRFIDFMKGTKIGVQR